MMKSRSTSRSMRSSGWPVCSALLRRNLLIYGLGGLMVPFIGIKLIDMLLVALHLA